MVARSSSDGFRPTEDCRSVLHSCVMLCLVAMFCNVVQGIVALQRAVRRDSVAR